MRPHDCVVKVHTDVCAAADGTVAGWVAKVADVQVAVRARGVRPGRGTQVPVLVEVAAGLVLLTAGLPLLLLVLLVLLLQLRMLRLRMLRGWCQWQRHLLAAAAATVALLADLADRSDGDRRRRAKELQLGLCRRVGHVMRRAGSGMDEQVAHPALENGIRSRHDREHRRRMRHAVDG